MPHLWLHLGVKTGRREFFLPGRSHLWQIARKKVNRVRMQVFYSGRVQGVGFRYTAKSVATGFEVTGTVRNLPDGAVAVEAEGPLPKLLDLLNRLREGPPAARVERVDVDWLAPHGQTQFQILSG